MKTTGFKIQKDKDSYNNVTYKNRGTKQHSLYMYLDWTADETKSNEEIYLEKCQKI